LNYQIIATDFLIGAKSNIKSYAAAFYETASPNVRNILTHQLNDAISMHEKITNYMIDNILSC